MRRPAAVVLTAVVPAAFALLAFARPATLFAESGGHPACTAVQHQLCADGGAPGSACVWKGLASSCSSSICYPLRPSDDAGDAEPSGGSHIDFQLACNFPAACINPGSLADCEGKAEGDFCRGAHLCSAGDCQRALDDGGRAPVLTCRGIPCGEGVQEAARCKVGAACGDGKVCQRAGCADNEGSGWINTQERTICAAPPDADADAPADEGSGCALGGEHVDGDGRGALGLATVFAAAFGLAWTRRSRRRATKTTP